MNAFNVERDQQDSYDSRGQHDEWRPIGAGNLVTQADERDPKVPVLRPPGSEPGGYRAHFVLRLGQRDPGLQPGNGLQPERPALPLLCARSQRHPRIQIPFGELEARWQYPDDGVRH